MLNELVMQDILGAIVPCGSGALAMHRVLQGSPAIFGDARGQNAVDAG